MDQQESDLQPKTEVIQEPKFPFTIRLMQSWLALVGVLPLLTVMFVFLRGAYLAITQETSTPNPTAETPFALLYVSYVISFGVYALVTIWGLQKRARASRWLALIVIGFVIARSAYYILLQNEFWAKNLPAELAFIDGSIVISIALLQLTMFYRFAFGKAEKAFLSK